MEDDIREDDFQRVIEAVELIKGVIHVEPALVTSEDHINRMRIKMEIATKVHKAIQED